MRKPLNWSTAKLEELRGGRAVSATGEDIQMLDGSGESMKDATIEEDWDKEIEEPEESITDKEQVQSDMMVTVAWLIYVKLY